MSNTVLKIKLILILFLSAVIRLHAQSDSLYFSPSVYYTHGIYSDKTNSNAYSFYSTLEPVKKIYLTNHFEKLFINNNNWDYDQNTILAGGTVDLFPVYVKFSYAHYAGKYSDNIIDYSYKDFTNLYNIDLFYFIDLWYLGSSFVYSNRIGYVNQKSTQYTLRLEKILSLYTFLSLKPTFTKTNTGKELYSVYAKFHYQPHTDILLKAGGFIGERINYFDSDLLTFFNQEEVQKYQAFAQAEYDAYKWLRLIFSYQSTGFKNFNISYFVFGIKSNLYL